MTWASAAGSICQPLFFAPVMHLLQVAFWAWADLDSRQLRQDSWRWDRALTCKLVCICLVCPAELGFAVLCMCCVAPAQPGHLLTLTSHLQKTAMPGLSSFTNQHPEQDSAVKWHIYLSLVRKFTGLRIDATQDCIQLIVLPCCWSGIRKNKAAIGEGHQEGKWENFLEVDKCAQ